MTAKKAIVLGLAIFALGAQGHAQLASPTAPSPAARQTILFDADWKFHRGGAQCFARALESLDCFIDVDIRSRENRCRGLEHRLLQARAVFLEGWHYRISGFFGAESCFTRLADALGNEPRHTRFHHPQVLEYLGH